MTARRIAVLVSVVALGLAASSAQAQIRSMNLSALQGSWAGRIDGDVTVFNENGRPIRQFNDSDAFFHKFDQGGSPIVTFTTDRGRRAVELTHIGQTFEFGNVHGGETFIVVKALFVRGDRVSYAFDFTETRSNGRNVEKIRGSLGREFSLGRGGLDVRQTIEKRITFATPFGRVFDQETRKEIWFGRLDRD